MSTSEKSFGAQMLEILGRMDDEDFEKSLRKSCPELFEGRGPRPPGAMVPNFQPDRVIAVTVSQIEKLGSVAAETTKALAQLPSQKGKNAKPAPKPAAAEAPANTATAPTSNPFAKKKPAGSRSGPFNKA